jgi:hypothetical protein
MATSYICVCMYIHTYIHTHAHTHMYTHTHTHVIYAATSIKNSYSQYACVWMCNIRTLCMYASYCKCLPNFNKQKLCSSMYIYTCTLPYTLIHVYMQVTYALFFFSHIHSHAYINICMYASYRRWLTIFDEQNTGFSPSATG